MTHQDGQGDTCTFCTKPATLTIRGFKGEEMECRCGTAWKYPKGRHCSIACYKRKSYWSLYGPPRDKEWSVGVEDECIGCGGAIVFDIAVDVIQDAERSKTE